MAKIKINLSDKSIQNAIQELSKYRNWVNSKTSQLIKELAEVGIPVIEDNMAKANYTYDSKNIRSGSNTEHYTHVKIHSFGSYSEATLILEGEEVLFIEYGAGVYYNGSAGSSPHPKGAVNGMVIGSYGKHHGVQKVWGYYDDNGDLVLTHGVKAQMPMYKAQTEIERQMVAVAKRVFSNYK